MSKGNHLTIYDWDDTFLPSSELYNIAKEQGVHAYLVTLTDTIKFKMAMIDLKALDNLKEALKYGDVVIITNADDGWVELTGKKFLPKTYKFIIDNKIRVISASQKYKGKTACTIEWKYFTMLDFFELNRNYYSVFSIGDSESEKQALIRVESYCRDDRITREATVDPVKESLSQEGKMDIDLPSIQKTINETPNLKSQDKQFEIGEIDRMEKFQEISKQYEYSHLPIVYKTFKMKLNPTYIELIQQLSLISGFFSSFKRHGLLNNHVIFTPESSSK